METRIKEMRKARKLTQLQMQKITGIDQSELSKIERGQRRPTLDQLAILAKTFETSMDYLAGLTSTKTPYPANRKHARVQAGVREE